MNDSVTATKANLLRRLLALLYDAILIIGIYMSYVILITYLNGSALENKLRYCFFNSLL